MSLVPLLSTSSVSYGTHSLSTGNDRVGDLTPDIGKKSDRELALFIGKIALVALLIVGLVAASVFTGGMAAAGVGAGIAFLKCFALCSASFATGGTAGMLFIGSAAKILGKIRGIPEKETDAKVNGFYRTAGTVILGGASILSLVGIPVFLIGGLIYKIATAPEVPRTEDIYNRRYYEALEMAEIRAQEISPAAKPMLAVIPQRREVTPGERQLDLLLSLTMYADLTKVKEELGRCSEDFRNTVYGQIWNLNPDTRDGSDPKWGENHLLDNDETLRQAIRAAYRITPNIL